MCTGRILGMTHKDVWMKGFSEGRNAMMLQLEVVPEYLKSVYISAWLKGLNLRLYRVA